MGADWLVSAANAPLLRGVKARRMDKQTVDLTVGSLQLADFTSAGNSWGEKGQGDLAPSSVPRVAEVNPKPVPDFGQNTPD